MINANDYVIDIESNSTQKDGNVWAIAILPVTNTVVYDLSCAECYVIQNNQGVISKDTTHWQDAVDAKFSQSPIALESGFSTMQEFVQATSTTMQPIHVTEIPDMRFGGKQPNLWANGKDFDPILLETALWRYNINPADYWHYRQWKDLPTLIWWKGLEAYKDVVRKQLEDYPYQHHPVFDCLIEAHYLTLANSGRVWTGCTKVVGTELAKITMAFEQWARNRIQLNKGANHYAST